jgi:membrane protein DedA with SNARE-associated domain
MGSIESMLTWFQHLAPAGVLGAIFLVAYIENIFPPSPCDVLLVFAGTLIGLGTIGFLPAVAAATLGGTLGFMTAYAAGRYFDRRILTGRFARFLPVNTIHQVERLFQRYGYGVIIANRFLAGTRAVVAFFAGMSQMNLTLTTLLSGLSALVWNSLLLYFGMAFANNWRDVAQYVQIYSTIATIVIVVVIGIFIWRYLRRRRALSRVVSPLSPVSPVSPDVSTKEQV